MNRQLIVLTIALVASVFGSPHHNKDRYQVSNTGGGYGTGEHHEQHSTTNAFNSESEYQQSQYGGHLNSGSGHLNGGGLGNGGLGNGGFSHSIHPGHGVTGQGGFGQGGLHQGGLGQGGFSQGGFGQGGFGQGGLNQGGLGQGGLNQGGLQHQQNFRSGSEIDGGSINIATDFPKKNDEAIVFGPQPISGDWSGIQQQTGMYEGSLTGGLRGEAPFLTSTNWGADPSRNYRKISSTAILPISYNNEQESKSVPKQQTSQNNLATDHGSSH